LSDGFSKKLAYTSVEAGQLLGLSTSTIQRMCRKGVLPTLHGIRVIRIPVSALEQYTNYNPDGAGSEFANPEGSRKCLKAQEVRESVSEREAVASITGCPTSTQAVKELKGLLGLPVRGKLPIS
jgi:excisionase family DNA binding protein